jgi:exo-beta-1,3-glucanase (GH17 family)
MRTWPVVAFKLPTLPPTQPEWGQFQIWWQQVVEAIEAQEALQDTTQADLADQLAQILAAQASADAAAANAATAQASAIAAARESARISSYPNPGSVLTADDVGSDSTITITSHTRVYPVQGSVDVPDVAITGGTITGKAFSTRYYIYYDDTTLANPTPTFLATTSSATAQVGAAAGRHFIGFVDTPADGGTSTGGQGGGPPGGGGGGGGGQIP